MHPCLKPNLLYHQKPVHTCNPSQYISPSYPRPVFIPSPPLTRSIKAPTQLCTRKRKEGNVCPYTVAHPPLYRSQSYSSCHVLIHSKQSQELKSSPLTHLRQHLSPTPIHLVFKRTTLPVPVSTITTTAAGPVIPTPATNTISLRSMHTSSTMDTL